MIRALRPSPGWTRALAAIVALSAIHAGCGGPGPVVSGSPCAKEADGTACDDGDACTQTDTCQAGVCTGKAPVVCTASDACHGAGVCDPDTGHCSDPPMTDGAACDDGDACTQTDTCQAGVCTGKSPVACAAADACHAAGVCDAHTGVCSNPPAADGAACDDGDACTQMDACQAGVCTGKSPVTCTAVDQCHVAGACDIQTGTCPSLAVPDGAPCDDGNPATPVDKCLAGVCVGSGMSGWFLWGGGQGNSTCATMAGRVRCWGANQSGQLGLGDAQNRGDNPGELGNTLPTVDLGTGRTAVSVASSGDHTCAVLDNGQLKCWGGNAFGDLGLGDTARRGDAAGEMGDNLPAVSLGAGRTAVAVATTASSTCAILDNGQLKCWGYNFWGQLGLGDVNNRGDAAGEMGDNLSAVDLGAGRTALAVSLSLAFSCALLDDHQIKCWGTNNHGELGVGDQNPRGIAPGEMGDSLPEVSLGAGRSALAVAVGDDHACALLDDHQVKCWGYNPDGELGQGDTLTRGTSGATLGDNLPVVNLGTGRTAVAITTGGYHTCALLDDTRLKCWGGNFFFGALGLGDTTSRGDKPGSMGDNLPAVDLGAGRTATRVVAGDYFSCAALDNQQVKCWGIGNFGNLGLGDTMSRGDNPGEMGDNLPAVDLGN